MYFARVFIPRKYDAGNNIALLRHTIRRFELYRSHDVSGVSGTGIVAKGCVFWSKALTGFVSQHVVLSWIKEPQTLSIWRSIDDLLMVHGHNNATTINWVDSEDEWLAHPDWYASSIETMGSGGTDKDPGKR